MSDIRDRISRIGGDDGYRLDPPNLGDSWDKPQFIVQPMSRPEPTSADDGGGVAGWMLALAAVVIGVVVFGD